MSKVTCVLFDLDGVLIDACEWHYQALNSALLRVVGYEISRQDHEEKYNGLPTRVKLSMLGIHEKEATEINRLKQEMTVDLIEEHVHFDFKKIELLSFLKRSNVKTGCVTNSIKKNTELMLVKSGLISYIDVIVANEDVKKNKPHPDCYNLAMEKLLADPEFTLCVEDSQQGILAARSSIAKFVWEVEGTDHVNLENYMRLWT